MNRILTVLLLVSVVFATNITNLTLNSNAQLCTSTPYRYTYCVLPATCEASTKLCSDGSLTQYGFPTPTLIPEKLSSFFLQCGIAVAIFGIMSVVFQRNMQPMRTRNLYFNIAEIAASFLLVRFAVGQTIYDPCFIISSINVVMLSMDKVGLIAQLILYRSKLRDETKLAKAVDSISTLEITELDVKPSKHVLDSLLGGVILFCGAFTTGAVLILVFTDLNITDLHGCNTMHGYPKTAETAFSFGITLITIIVTLSWNNPEASNIFCIRTESCLCVFSAFVTVAYLGAFYGAKNFLLLAGDNAIVLLIEEHITYLSLMIKYAVNIGVRCLLPLIYAKYVYNRRSVVDDEIREKFTIAKQQSFAMKKLVDHARTELETESIVLYQAVLSIRQLRQSTTDTFADCESLATMIYENYIHGARKTLDFYDLRGVVSDIRAPIELLEKEATVLVALENGILEQIMLPMFARMTNAK